MGSLTESRAVVLGVGAPHILVEDLVVPDGLEVQSPLPATEEAHGYFVAAVVAVAIPVIAFGGVERLVHVADQMDEHLEREDSHLGRLSRVSQGLLEVLDP